MDKANGGKAWTMTAVSIMLGVCFAVSMYKAVATLPFIMEDYGVNIAQAGNLMAILGYLSMAMSLPGGFIIKKVGAKRAAVVCTLLAIAGNAIAIWSQSFAILLASRVFEGVGYGLISIIMQSVINAWFTPERRGLPLSLSNLYLSVGMIFALNISSVITPVMGWKGNWWLNLGMYAVILVVFALVIRMPEIEGEPTIPETGEVASERGSLKALKSPTPWFLALCFFCYAFSFAAFNSYYPTFLSQSLGMDSAVANSMTSIYTVAMIASTFLIGVLLNIIEPRKHTTVLIVCMVLYAASSIPMFILSDGAIVPYLMAFGLLSGTVPGVIFSIAPRAFTDSSMVPVTLGVIMFGMGIAGSVGTQVVGAIVELTGWAGVTILFASLAALGCLAAVAVNRVLK